MTVFDRKRRESWQGSKVKTVLMLGLDVLLLVTIVVGVGHLVARYKAQPGAIPRAYAHALTQEIRAYEKEMDGWKPEWHFGLGYVDGDDVPELLAGNGDSHPQGIQIYSYNPETDSVVKWGEFGEFGRATYCQGQGIVVDNFGGQGVFYTFYHQGGINGVEKVLAAELYNGFREELECFWRSDCDSTDVEQLIDEFDIVPCEVSEEEYYKNVKELWSGFDEPVTVYYREMQPYTPQALYEAYKTATTPAHLDE